MVCRFTFEARIDTKAYLLVNKQNTPRISSLKTGILLCENYGTKQVIRGEWIIVEIDFKEKKKKWKKIQKKKLRKVEISIFSVKIHIPGRQ